MKPLDRTNAQLRRDAIAMSQEAAEMMARAREMLRDDQERRQRLRQDHVPPTVVDTRQLGNEIARRAIRTFMSLPLLVRGLRLFAAFQAFAVGLELER
jgi:hypothetical protein